MTENGDFFPSTVYSVSITSCPLVERSPHPIRSRPSAAQDLRVVLCWKRAWSSAGGVLVGGGLGLLPGTAGLQSSCCSHASQVVVKGSLCFSLFLVSSFRKEDKEEEERRETRER